MEIKWIDDREGRQKIIIHINRHTIEVSEEGDGFSNGAVSMCEGEYGSLETMLKHKWVYRKNIDMIDEFETE
jgi:hypothetical protein